MAMDVELFHLNSNEEISPLVTLAAGDHYNVPLPVLYKHPNTIYMRPNVKG